MSTAASVERRIAAVLAEEALVRAPEGALADVLTVVAGTTQRHHTWPSPLIAVRQLDGRQRLLVAVAAALLFAGIVVAGALLLRPPDPREDLSSLVIVEHQPYVEGAAPRPVAVLAIAPDGTQSSLMTIQPDQLDGAYSEWYAGLSVDGHLVVPTSTEGGGSVPAVLDLRDPTAHAVSPDAEGAFPHFGPDGRLAMSQNDGRVAIFDPLSAKTFKVDAASNVTLAEHEFGPVWTSDGGLLTTTGPVVNGYVGGQIDPEDLTTTSGARPYYSGAGARRVDASGRLLRCDPASDETCEGPITLHAVADGTQVVWTQRDSSVRVIDYAWAIDGGIWILTETAAAGPRTVTLLRVSTDGSSESIATLAGGADDADPNSYSQAASLAAFASDDARIVVAVAGQPPQLWSIDPKVRSATRLPDGIVAGWLRPSMLSSPRPAVERASETPEAMRGVWTRDGVLMTVHARGIDFPRGHALGTTAGRMTPDGDLVFDGSYPGCAAGPVTYRWALGDAGLGLVPTEDGCPERAALLGGTFERALGYPDTGSGLTEQGTAYAVDDFTVPFRVTTPPDLPTSVESHSPTVVTVSGRVGSGMPIVTFMIPGYGVDQPCDGRASARTQLAPDGVGAYLQRQTQVSLEPMGTLTVGNEKTRFVHAVPVDGQGCTEIALFATSESFRPWTIQESTRIGVAEVGGTDVVVLVSTDAGSESEERWVSELLGSIEWAQ